MIHGAVLAGGHQPRTGIVWDARLGPLFEGSDQSVLRKFFGEADVAHNARETGNNPGGLNPPNGFDGAMDSRGRHGLPSHHLRWTHARPRRRCIRLAGGFVLLGPLRIL